MLGVGTTVSHSRSAVPAWICCCTGPASWPIWIWMWSTYWCRSGSAACVHAGFLSSRICWLAVYLTILYGPSEIVCCRKVASSGT